MSPIVIGNAPANGHDDFSPRFQAVLELIPGGRDWLDWALTQNLATISSGHELELLEQIQEGLHGTPLITLSAIGLTLHPERLWVMESKDLGALTAAAQGDASGSVNFVLPKYGLLDEAALSAVDGYLQQLQVGAAPALANRSLDDRIELYQMRSALAGDAGEANREAAAFALRHAQTVREFIAYLYSYRAFATGKKAASTVAGRNGQAEQLLTAVAPLCYPNLNTLDLGHAPSLESMITTLRSWISGGHRVGYPSVAEATADLLTHAGTPGAKPSDKQVSEHLRAAHELILSTDPAAPATSQDGSHLTLSFQGEVGRAVVTVREDGVTTLNAFIPAAAAAPTKPATGEEAGVAAA